MKNHSQNELPLNVSVFIGVLIAVQMGLIIILLAGFCLRKQSRLFANSSFVYGLLTRLIIINYQQKM